MDLGIQKMYCIIIRESHFPKNWFACIGNDVRNIVLKRSPNREKVLPIIQYHGMRQDVLLIYYMREKDGVFTPRK